MQNKTQCNEDYMLSVIYRVLDILILSGVFEYPIIAIPYFRLIM